MPPTDKNLLAYEKWVKEEVDKTEFFGDLAEGCCRLEIIAGMYADSRMRSVRSIVDAKLFFSDPTFQEISDPVPIPGPT